MSDLASLPADITPVDFFELVERMMADESGPPNASPEKAQVNLVGDGGGSWTMGFEGSQLKLSPGKADAPPVQITMTVDDWRSVVAGEVRDTVQAATGVAALDPKQLAKLYKSSEKVEQLKALPGSLQLCLDDTDKGTSCVITITTGGGEPAVAAPTAKLNIGAAVFTQIVSGQLDPQTAFFMGQIAVDGDMNFVMGLAGTMMG